MTKSLENFEKPQGLCMSMLNYSNITQWTILGQEVVWTFLNISVRILNKNRNYEKNLHVKKGLITLKRNFIQTMDVVGFIIKLFWEIN